MELLKVDLVEGHPPMLHLEGEVDISTADQLEVALNEALASHPDVVVDLGGTTFFDAAGIRVLLQVAETLNGAGPLLLANATRLAQLLELVGLSDLTSIRMQDGGDVRGR